MSRPVSAVRFGSLPRVLSVLAGIALLTPLPRSSAAHEDPPAPPLIYENLYLEELTLKTDQDDGVNGETEIIIRTRITHAGHHDGEFVLVVEDIDMEPPNETSFTVLDGTQTAPERRGGRKLMYDHLECSPRAPMLLDIDVIEVNTTSAGDIIRKMGAAAAGTTSDDLTKGAGFIGAVAALIGGIIDAIGNDETNLGTETMVVPDGVSAESNPTVNYGYKTRLDTQVLNSVVCGGTLTEDLYKSVQDGTLPAELVPSATAILQGHDETHPFTKNADAAAVRTGELLGVFDLIPLYAEQPGEAQENAEAHRQLMAQTTAAIARVGLDTEIEEAPLNDVAPDLLAQAEQLRSDGDAAAPLDPALATAMYTQGVLLLLPANHPEFQPNPPVPLLGGRELLVAAALLLGSGVLAWRRLGTTS